MPAAQANICAAKCADVEGKRTMLADDLALVMRGKKCFQDWKEVPV